VMSRSIIGALWLATASLGALAPASAVTAVSATEYGLQVTHSEVGRVELDQGKQGLELKVTLSNQGSHDLYDVRLFLERAGSRAMLRNANPARMQVLAAGAQTVLTWTFELDQAIVGPLREVSFHIQAVDEATQKIVTFNQKSREAR